MGGIEPPSGDHDPGGAGVVGNASFQIGRASVMGLIYTVKNKLRSAFPVLIFSLLLTVAYSLLQGNVGTAYRQRTQIQVFLFIMIGVGWTVYREKKENMRLRRSAAQRHIDEQLRGYRSPKQVADNTPGIPEPKMPEMIERQS